MMKMSKKMFFLSTLCSVSLIFAGCSASSSTTNGTASKGKDPVTLTFVMSNTDDQAPYQKIFTEYQKETGNKVEIQALPSADYDNMMKTRFSTSDFPDVFLMQPGTKQNIKLQADQTLKDWSGDADVWKDIIPSMKQFQTTANGKIYGVPYGTMGTYGIFYNKAVFKKVGVEPPKNYDDLINIAKKIKSAGITPFYEAVKDSWPTQVFLLSGWVTEVDPVIKADGINKLNKNQLKLSDIPQVKDLFTKQKQLKDLGLDQTDIMAGTYDDLQNKLGNGSLAMTFMIDGVLSQLEQKFGKQFVTDNIGWFPFPSATDTGTALITPPEQLMVPTKSQHPTEAANLVKFMLKPDMVNLFYQTHPGIPIFKNAKSDLFPAQKSVKDYIDAGKSVINVQNRLTPTFLDLGKTLQTFFLDGDVNKAVKEFSDNYEQDGKAKRLSGF